ncbi:MAG: response regulator transcription factor [Candidatus Limnocylindria bacterium]
MRILVVEDEVAIATSLRDLLIGAGHATDIATTGHEALEFAAAYPYDLVVLDIVLPGMDGRSVARSLRRSGYHSPILMLTALDAVDDRVAGLDAGADDYLAKPFAAAELHARVRALLRRNDGERLPVARVGDVELDPVAHLVRRNGTPVRLTAKEFELLEFLMRHPEQLLSRERLIDAVWNADFAPESNVVEVYIRSLRRKLDDGRHRMIETVRGSGYRMVGDTSASDLRQPKARA